MNLSAAHAIQNRGSFQVAETALKSGNSSSDRQSGGESYMSFQHTDSLHFQRFAAQPEIQTTEDRLLAMVNKLFSLDTRVYTSLVVTLFFGMIFQAIFEAPVLTAVSSLAFFFVWYVMSFFDFQRLMQTLAYGSAA
jgi:hypothetical protein